MRQLRVGDRFMDHGSVWAIDRPHNTHKDYWVVKFVKSGDETMAFEGDILKWIRDKEIEPIATVGVLSFRRKR